MGPIELLIGGFDALQYITNPYALIAFMFLAGTVFAGLFLKDQVAKATWLIVFAGFAFGAVYKLLDTTLDDIENQVLVHLVRGGGRQLVAPDVRVELLNIETLKGKKVDKEKSWEFNFGLADGDHVFDEVFLRSGHSRKGAEIRDKMDGKSWRKLFKTMEEGSTEERLQAEKIKDIPFARFRVFVDGLEDRGFIERYFFKNEVLCVPSNSTECSKAKLEIVNIYNTKHSSSGENEALNLRVLRN